MTQWWRYSSSLDLLTTGKYFQEGFTMKDGCMSITKNLWHEGCIDSSFLIFARRVWHQLSSLRFWLKTLPFTFDLHSLH